MNESLNKRYEFKLIQIPEAGSLKKYTSVNLETEIGKYLNEGWRVIHNETHPSDSYRFIVSLRREFIQK